MLRRAFMFVSLVSLRLCAASAVLWAASFGRPLVLVRSSAGGDWQSVSSHARVYRTGPAGGTREVRFVHSSDGTIAFGWRRDHFSPLTPLGFARELEGWSTEGVGSEVSGRPPREVGALGFAIVEDAASLRPGRGYESREVRVPYWFVAAVTAVAAIPAAGRMAARWRRLRRVRRGRCPACGYDVRASPDRCPECGERRSAAGNGHHVRERLAR